MTCRRLSLRVSQHAFCNHQSASQLDPNRRDKTRIFASVKMVGPVRFELTTSCTPCKRATRLRYGPNQRTVTKRHAGESGKWYFWLWLGGAGLTCDTKV